MTREQYADYMLWLAQGIVADIAHGGDRYKGQGMATHTALEGCPLLYIQKPDAPPSLGSAGGEVGK